MVRTIYIHFIYPVQNVGECANNYTVVHLFLVVTHGLYGDHLSVDRLVPLFD